MRRSKGEIPLGDLTNACRQGVRDLGPLDLHDVVDVLECAGLIRREGTLRRDPVRLRAVATVFNLSDVPSRANTLHAQLLRDLACVLDDLHSMAVDFYRTSAKGTKELVPESVFCAFIVLGLRLLGWSTVEREAVSGSGRTDIKARHGGFPGELAILEVKIWPRNDYAEVHQQVVGYWSAGVTAAAVVMLSDANLPEWPVTYRKKCLDGRTSAVEGAGGTATVREILSARSSLPGGLEVRVEHHLLCLPRD